MIKNPGKSKEFMAKLREEYIDALTAGGYQKRFVKPSNLEGCNKILYALLYSYDIKPSELSEYVFVENNAVYRWLKGIYIPIFFYQEKISELLNIDKNILFSTYAYNTADIPMFELEGVNRTMLIKPRNRYIVKKIFYGLLWTYDLTTYTLAYATGINQDTISRYIFTERMPKKDNPNIIKLTEFFNLPYEILFMNFKDVDVREKLDYYNNL